MSPNSLMAVSETLLEAVDKNNKTNKQHSNDTHIHNLERYNKSSCVNRHRSALKMYVSPILTKKNLDQIRINQYSRLTDGKGNVIHFDTSCAFVKLFRKKRQDLCHPRNWLSKHLTFSSSKKCSDIFTSTPRQSLNLSLM